MLRRLLQSVATDHASNSLLVRECHGPSETLHSRVVEVGAACCNTSGVQHIERIVRHGVWISEFRNFGPEETSASMVKSLRIIVCVPTKSKTRSTLAGAHSLRVSDSSSSSVNRGLLLAAQVSQSLSYLKLEVKKNPALLSRSELAERRKLWQWIAFAFFSRDARHKIRELSLDASWISMVDIEAIREVINADDPFAFMFGVESMKHRLLIRSRCFYLKKPSKFSPQARRVEFEKKVVARVLTHREHDDGWWWTVVLPGCGHAWVKEEDAVSENDEAELGESSRSIRMVTIENMSDRTKPVVMSFLDMIKDTITAIALGTNGSAVEVDEWCDQVFLCCSKLKTLDLSHVGDFSVFARSAEAGHLRLRNLKIFNSIDLAQLMELITALADPRCAIAQTMRKVSIGIVGVPDTESQPLNLVLQAILEHNRRLCSFVVTFEGYDVVPFVGAGETAVVHYGPLKRAQRIAFLSAVRAKTTAMSMLDSWAIMNIFGYAARLRDRKVHLSYL